MTLAATHLGRELGLGLLFGVAALTGVALTLIGWRALALRRPFVVPTILLAPSVLLAVLGGGVMHFAAAFDRIGRGDDAQDEVKLLLSIAGFLLVCGMWRMRRAHYAIFGITEPALYNAVRATLGALGLEHKIKDKKVTIGHSRAEFLISITSWQGIGHIAAKRVADSPLLRDVVRAMGPCFDSDAVALSRFHCTRYVVLGSALAVAAIAAELFLVLHPS